MKRFLWAVMLAGLCTAPAAAQQAYPSKPVRLIVGWPPGGTTDALARIMAQSLSQSMKQSVVVENKPGAAGLIATQVVAKSPPDGYTLLVADTSFAMVPATRKSMPYDTLADFTSVALTGGMPVVLAVPSSLGVSTVDELKALSRTRRLTYASGGPGTVFHLLAELARRATGIEAEHIPYKGGSEMTKAVLGEQVQIMYNSASSVLPYVQSGKVKALAVITTGGRLASLPDVPTMAELGYGDLAMTQWYGVLAPAGTPPEIVRRLSAEVKTALGSQDVKDKFLPLGWSLTTGSAEELRSLIVSDLERWKTAATLAKLEQE